MAVLTLLAAGAAAVPPTSAQEGPPPPVGPLWPDPEPDWDLFGAPDFYEMPGRQIDPQSTAVGDVTGDGRTDVVVTAWLPFPADATPVTSRPAALLVFAGRSDGTLAPPITLSSSTLRPDKYWLMNLDVEVGDIDGDGDDDVVVAVSGGIDLYTQEDGILSGPSLIPAAGDAVSALVLADLTGDGRLDLVTATATGRALVFEGPVTTGDNPRDVSGGIYHMIKVGDINGDGRADLIRAREPDPIVYVSPQSPDGTFPTHQRLYIHGFLSSIEVADVTGDGRDDVLAAGGLNKPYAYLNVFTQTEEGTLGGPQVRAAWDVADDLDAADVDGDGSTDLIATYGSWYVVGVFRQIDGGLGPEHRHDFPGWNLGPDSVSTGDITGDGRIDVVMPAAFARSDPLDINRLMVLPAVGAPPDPRGPGPTPPGHGQPDQDGYWALRSSGAVMPFGTAAAHGDASGHLVRGEHAVDLAADPASGGYWVVDGVGRVYAFGGARWHGNLDPTVLARDERVVAIAPAPHGGGYWIVTDRGRVTGIGPSAPGRGDLVELGLAPNGPIVDAAVTATGQGYWLVGADGGVFSFGDARFHGSTGGMALNAPVGAMASRSDGDGYWLFASDGGVFSFAAPFRGSAADLALLGPIVGGVAHGDGYLLVAGDGGVFNYSNRSFHGSAAGGGPDDVVAIAPVPA